MGMFSFVLWSVKEDTTFRGKSQHHKDKCRSGTEIRCCREQLWLFRSMHFHCAERLGAKVTRYALRRKNPVDGRWYCGTVITVPYRMVTRRGDSRIARRPNGAGKSPDAKNGKTTGPASNHHVIASPQGRGNLPHSCRRLPRRLSAPRNDVVVLAGPSDLGGWLLMCGRAGQCPAPTLDFPNHIGYKRAPAKAGAQMLLGISCRYDTRR